ncbi:hypothetical protein T484DRAFT_3425405 [Baffinella frigidus]|nr:hypothetical protein T484DRAFT_3425405 [Cryptophyta sp. CCMP2293]
MRQRHEEASSHPCPWQAAAPPSPRDPSARPLRRCFGVQVMRLDVNLASKVSALHYICASHGAAHLVEGFVCRLRGVMRIPHVETSPPGPHLADRPSADAGPSGAADPRPLRRGEVGLACCRPGDCM